MQSRNASLSVSSRFRRNYLGSGSLVIKAGNKMLYFYELSSLSLVENPIGRERNL